MGCKSWSRRARSAPGGDADSVASGTRSGAARAGVYAYAEHDAPEIGLRSRKVHYIRQPRPGSVRDLLATPMTLFCLPTTSRR